MIHHQEDNEVEEEEDSSAVGSLSEETLSFGPHAGKEWGQVWRDEREWCEDLVKDYQGI